MKTLLVPLGLTAVFFAIGIAGVRMVGPRLFPAAQAAPADSATVTPGEVGAIAGEVADLRRQLARAEASADSLREAMEARQLDEQTTQAQATELAGTLVKLGDDELAAIVQRLDGNSFVDLYTASSQRNQVRLLSALTPAQAAAFVRHQLPGAGAPSSAPADTSATR